MNLGEVPFRMDGEQRLLKVSEVKLYEKKMGKIVEPPIKMRDMSKDMKWLNEHGKEYEGKWVAIYEGRLIASSHIGAEVFAEKDRAGFPQSLVTFIEEPIANLRS